MCALDKYLITVISYSYGVMMYHAINLSDHGKNVVDGHNTTDKYYLKENGTYW